MDLVDEVDLFHTPAGEPFATVAVLLHRENYQVRSAAFRSWLRRQYWHLYRQPPSSAAMTDAVETIAASAEFGSATHPIWLRVGRDAERVYVDLANDAWQAVEITVDGWHVVDSPPIHFRRPATMEPLPIPERGGSLELLRPFLNLADGDAWHLFAGYLVAAFRPQGPYLVLVLHGEQGSAKSTTTRIARLLVDPGRGSLRAEPREQQDLLIAARNNWIVAFDNVSRLQPWLSDALCRLSTGGGLGKRQLYTDVDEIVLEAQRPQVLNGISEAATRGDLLDRAIIVEQPAIGESARRSEDEYWRAFGAVRPRILGALFDAVSGALANERRTVLGQLPRMADPARWVTAAEPALGWPAGTFAGAYRRNRREGSALALETSPIAGAVQELVSDREWLGTASQLLDDLALHADDDSTRQRGWPKSPRAIAAALKRIAPHLRAMGIEWTRVERTGNARLHQLRRVAETTVTTVIASRDERDGHDGPAPAVGSAIVAPLDSPDEQMRWTG